MAFPRFRRQTQVETGVRNPSAGQDMAVLASELEAFSARRQTDLDRQAAEAGFTEGQQAGIEGEAPTDSATTIRGRAFNRGVILAHQAALQTDIRDSIGQFELDHPNDPEAFEVRVKGLEDGLLEEASPQLQPFVQARIADYAGRSKLRIIAQQQTELLAQAATDLERGVEGFVEDARTAAFEGDINLVEARRQEINELLGEALKGEILDEAEVLEVRDQFERAVTSQEVLGNFDRVVRNDGIDAGTESLQRWQDVKPSAVGLSVDDHQAVTRQMVTMRNRQNSLLADQRRRQAAALQAERKARTNRVRDSIKVMRKGFAPDQDQAHQASEDLVFLDDPELAFDYDVAQAIQGEVHRFRRMPSPARAAELNVLERKLRRGGARDEEVQLLESLKATHTQVDQELEADPRGYVNREGLIEDQPLDFSSAESLVESIQLRTEGTDIGNELIGEPLPLVSAAEADQLAQVYEQSEIEQRVGLLGIITAGAGDEAAATLAQLDAKGHTRMALLGDFVLSGQGALARDIMRGEAVLVADPGVKPKRIDYQAPVDDIIGAAYSDAPEVRAEYLEAAFAKYAQLKASTGDLSDIYDSRLFENALKQVLPTARFNGRRIAVPPGVSEDTFETWTDSWTAETFARPVGVTPEIEPLVIHGQANLKSGDDFSDKAGKHAILSVSVQDQRLNDGAPTVIPTVYGGKKLSVKKSIERAIESGIEWPSAATEDEATEISMAASEAMDQFDDAGLPTMGVPGITAENLLQLVRDDGRLVELGRGRYGVAVVSAATGLDRILVEDHGAPFILELPRQVE